jgi:signal transduction histidine kinase/ligand-binding sensor domain-containing protein
LDVPRTRFRLVLVTICFLGFFAALRGQPIEGLDARYALRVWDTDDGLPHNEINTVVQRRDGFLWVVTAGGLVRFDGAEFAPLQVPFLAKNKNLNIRGAIEENANGLVVLSDGAGLLRLQGGDFARHPIMDAVGARKAQQLFREADDVFWVVFSNKDAMRWDHGRTTLFPALDDIAPWPDVSFAQDRDKHVFLFRGSGIEQLVDDRLVPVPDLRSERRTIASSRTGGIWVASRRRLSRLESGRLITQDGAAPWHSAVPPAALLEAHDGSVWAGVTGSGVVRWTRENTTVVSTSHARTNELFEDDEDNIWVCTAGGGLDRVQPARFALIAEDASWTTDRSGAVCEDALGDVWFTNRQGVRRLHGGVVEKISQPGWPTRAVTMTADRAGHIWMGDGARLWRADANHRDQPPVLEENVVNYIRVLYVARDGALWVGGRGRLERFQGDHRELFGPEEGFSGNDVQAIGEDAQGNVWVGTAAGELFEKQQSGIRKYEQPAGLSGSGIRSIHGDAEGTLWIGTVGAGLLVYREGRFFSITAAQGLIDDVVSQILEDDSGWLWFGSRRGLFTARKGELLDFVSGKKYAINPVAFGRGDGLSGISAIGSYQPTAWKTREGRLWFVTKKGLVTTDPSHHRTNRNPPRVYLERFSVNETEVPAASRPRLRSSDRRFEFRFTAPTYTAPDNVRFRYRLEGLDREWSEPTLQHFASYSALSPGHYRFVVAAGGGDLGWSTTPAEFAFDVEPQWWELVWVQVGLGLVLAGALIFLVRTWSLRRIRARVARLEQEHRIERERTRIARDLHDDLGSSLTQLGMMAEELADDWDTMTDAKQQSAKFATRVKTIARDLDAVVWTVSPKNDRLDLLCAYLCDFADEYFHGSSVQCQALASADIPPAPLTPEIRHHLFMIAKELMNNVLKHARATRIELKLSANEGIFEMWVSDDGCGFSLTDAEASDRNGLRNLRARVEECRGQLTIEPLKPGTRAVVKIPIETNALRSHVVDSAKS